MVSGKSTPGSLEIIETEEKTDTVTVYAVPAKHNGGGPAELKAELPQYYTAPPWKLMWDDLLLFIRKAHLLPLVVLPLWYPPRRDANYPKLDRKWVPPMMASTTIINIVDAFQSVFQRLVDPMFPSGEMDELYPSVGNLICLAAHTVLIGTQLAFLVSLPLLAFFPFHVFLPYFIGFIFVNYIACIPLNAGCNGGVLLSRVTQKGPDDEQWLFLNGVSVGTHWLQGNLDRLDRTFHRPILGIHNETAGIIFDVIQCLIERCFYYGTSDTRACYALIAGALGDPKKNRVILILHSQGARWGVTHFKKRAKTQRRDEKAYGPIMDALSQTPKRQNSFQGRLFELKGKWGHLLNQHYLDRILPLNRTLTAVEEGDNHDFETYLDEKRTMGRLLTHKDHSRIMKNSKLWKYVNGKRPNDLLLTNGSN
ncbi:uncharacterized protein GLRG_08607 [Colletotrichum graminicola M1.001]|uniref:Uncharacterized protein n=1 Tax=Colletotrichum graminicola (strain M1.001 / M2 / FGSC 10212) TaxID=645133 RepID=E3QS40_COLGM|nr:uncharacterized protein GLRG_08607 [Colletotrichum graminicola M1.001]EFQ33678.1 hypothetical protein GLRG_08607 [Colletotrichum graminicola M1.001]